MEPKIIETPNGYKVSLRPYITQMKFIELQSRFTDGVTLDVAKVGAGSESDSELPEGKISLSSIIQASLDIGKWLVLKVEDPQGTVMDISEDFLPIPPKDARVVLDEIDIIANEASEYFSKKN